MPAIRAKHNHRSKITREALVDLTGVDRSTWRNRYVATTLTSLTVTEYREALAIVPPAGFFVALLTPTTARAGARLKVTHESS